MASETSGGDKYQPGTTSETQHGWAPDAPGEGDAHEQAAEADRKAFEAADDTQAASRGDAQLPEYPEGVGESTTRRAEDVARQEGKERGRYDSGTQGESQRPYGGSTAEASTGVDPQEPVDESMPPTQTGDQGG
jgi:hypothetical protein